MPSFYLVVIAIVASLTFIEKEPWPFMTTITFTDNRIITKIVAR